MTPIRKRRIGRCANASQVEGFNSGEPSTYRRTRVSRNKKKLAKIDPVFLHAPASYEPVKCGRKTFRLAENQDVRCSALFFFSPSFPRFEGFGGGQRRRDFIVEVQGKGSMIR